MNVVRTASAPPPVPLPETARAARPRRAVLGWQVGLTSAATAALANLAVLLTASALGAELVVRRTVGEPGTAIDAGSVLVATLVPVLLGTLMLVALHRRRPWAWRALSVIGLTVGLVTVPIPFMMLAGTGTQVALGLMHAITGISWFVLVGRAAARPVI